MGTRKYYSVICLFACFVCSCSSSNFLSSDVVGTYFQTGKENMKLSFGEKSFLYIDTFDYDHLPPFACCDTLAFGFWEIDSQRGILSLSTPEFLNESIVHINVIEDEKHSKDSLYFVIDNPIERHFEKYNQIHTEISYQLMLGSDNFDLDSKLSSKRFNTNFIVIPSHGRLVNKISINIYPKTDFRGREINTREIYSINYEVNNENTNVFRISIPQLTYGYISYKRLHSDYLKIVSKNKLIWDGQEYVKLK